MVSASTCLVRGFLSFSSRVDYREAAERWRAYLEVFHPVSETRGGRAFGPYRLLLPLLWLLRDARSAVAARNAAIDQAVREQRERDEKMKAAASRDALEEKLRRMKEEGQRLVQSFCVLPLAVWTTVSLHRALGISILLGESLVQVPGFLHLGKACPVFESG